MNTYENIFFFKISKRTIGVGTITARQSVNFDRVRVTCGHCRRSILVSFLLLSV